MLYSHLKCLLSNVFYLIIMCFFCSCSIELCTSISKTDAPISQSKELKKTLHSGEEKGSVSFRRKRIPCSFCKTTYFATGPICLQHHLFVESYMNYYCSFCTLIHIKHVFIFFYSCYCITTHWSLFLMRLFFFVPCQSMMWCSL